MSVLRNACILHAIGLLACSEDITYGPDSGQPKSDATIDQSTSDAGPEASVGPRVLMTYAATSGELVSFGTSSAQVLGRLAMPGYGTVQKTGADYFVLESGADTVVKLDPVTLTKSGSTWSMAGTDATDGGSSYADPVQIIEASATKAYVLRFNRNRIAVFDPSLPADAGAPTSTIDLSSLVQSADGDHAVDMSGAAFDATRHRLYVVLGNVDLGTVQPPNYALICVSTKMTMMAIDTTNDTLVDLGGSGPGGSVALNGYNPQMGYYGGVTLDVAGDRIFVVSFGCNMTDGDGGLAPVQQRLVEAFDLKTNTTKTLLDANAQDYPNVFKLIDSTHAVIQFGSFAPYISTFVWDTTQTTLPAALPTGPDVFDYDDAGHILGPQSTFATDGAAGPINVINVTLADGGSVVLGQNPFTQSGGYLGNALYVP